MFRTGEAFDYGECTGCGTLQILELPERLDELYEHDYYSLKPPSRTGPGRLTRARYRDAGGQRNLVGRALNLLLSPPSTLAWVRHVRHDPSGAIADVGCGNGGRLQALSIAGCADLTGFEPHLPDEIVSPGRFVIHAEPLSATDRRFDLITYHHVLEHVLDPLAELTDASSRLADGGTLVIRTPIHGSRAWKKYGVDWAQLDAPRHLHVFTVGALEQLAEEAGLTIEATTFDSTPFQFWGSEFVQRGGALSKARGIRYHPLTRRISPLGAVERYRSWQYNRAGIGDQVLMALRRPA